MADATALSYSACVDLTTANIGFAFSAELDRAGESTATVTVGSLSAAGSRYLHHSIRATSVSDITGIYAPWSSYKNAAEMLEDAMELECSSQAWGNDLFTVVFAHDIGKYSIANQTAGSGVFDITFGNTASANFFGFTSVANTGASMYISDVIANYCIVPSYDVRSNFTAEYEPGNISSLAVSDSGQVKKGIVRASVPLYMDWQQVFEPEVKIRTVDATTSILFTWQQFWEHCRQNYPFVINNTSPVSGQLETHMLRSTVSNFDPEPVEVDNHEYFHLNFETHFIGRVA